MTTLNLFSDADVATIKEMVRWFSTHRNTPFSEEADETGHQAPEVYIALVPSGGIPAIQAVGSGEAGDIPGTAQCDIYQINQYGELTKISGLSKTIYNLSSSAIGVSWIPVMRDKLGRWLAVSVTGGGSGGSGTTFTIKRGKANQHIYQNTSGNVEFYDGSPPASITDQSVVHSVYSRYGDIQHNAWVAYYDTGGGQYEALQSGCPVGTAS